VDKTERQPLMRAWYSHDNTLYSLASILETYFDNFMPFASHFIFELHQTKGCFSIVGSGDCYGIKIIKNNEIVKLSGPCAGKEICPWEDFINWEKEYVLQTSVAQKCADMKIKYEGRFENDTDDVIDEDD
jgi:hypothetical protein